MKIWYVLLSNIHTIFSFSRPPMKIRYVFSVFSIPFFHHDEILVCFKHISSADPMKPKVFIEYILFFHDLEIKVCFTCDLPTLI